MSTTVWIQSQAVALVQGSDLGGVVLGGRDEHGEIHWGLDVIDLPAVLLHFLQNLSWLSTKKTVTLKTKSAGRFTLDNIPVSFNLGTELVDLSIFMAGNDKLAQRPPDSTGDLVLAAG